jgi:sugar lactone lactonase YvrE
VARKGLVYASDPNWKEEKGQVWMWKEGAKLKLVAKGMGTTNGIEVSPSEKVLYVNESIQRRIWAFDIGPGGALKNKRKLAEFPDHGLDGMRCDVKGNLYVTRYGKGSIAVLTPKGKLLREVRLSGRRPSNIAFAGEDGCTAYVTEVDHGRIEAFRVEWPGREWDFWQD